MNKCIFLFGLVLCLTNESMIYLSRDTRLQGREGREETGRMKEKRSRKEMSDIIYKKGDKI